MGLFDGLKRALQEKVTAQVQTKVTELVNSRYGGDFRKAFQHYDELTIQNGRIDAAALIQLLEDAGVESALADHQKISEGIIEKFDSSGDDEISWEEFSTVFESPTR